MSSPVMAVRVVASVAELKKALAEGKAEIVTTTAAMSKLAAAFQGDKLVQHAHNVTAALGQTGVAALSAREAARQVDVLERAMAKLEATARPVPAAMAATAAALRKVVDDAKPPEGPSASSWWKDFAGQVTASAAGFFTAQAAIGAVSSGVRLLSGFVLGSIESAAGAEAAQTKLTAALRAQGTATPEVIAQYNEMAGSLQRTSVYSDDLANEMQGLLVQVGGVMPSQMRQALAASSDLASGLGIDLQQATMIVAKAAAGHTETLGRYGIQVESSELKTKGFAAVLEAVNRQFGGQAVAQAETYTGSVAKLANAWDNVKEAVGRKLIQAPILLAAINSLTAASDRSSASLDEEASAQDRVTAAMSASTRFLPVVGPIIDVVSQAWTRASNAAALYNAMVAAGQRGEKNRTGLADGAADQTAQRILAAGMAESARLADEDAKKKKVAEAATKALAAANLEYAAAVKRAVEAGRGSLAVLDSIDGAVVEAIRYYKAQGSELADLGVMYGLTAAQVAVLGDQLKLEGEMAAFNGRMHVGLTQSLGGVGLSLGPLVSRQLPQFSVGLVGAAAAASNLAARTATLGEKLKSDLSSVLTTIPGTLARAFEGGGGLRGAMTSIGSQVGASLGKTIGAGIKSLGKFGGPLGEAVGSLAGPLIEKLFAIGGPSAAERAGRDAARAFEQGVAAQLTESQRAEAGGRAWAATVIGVRDAYLAVGRSAAEAEAAVQQLWAAERQGPEAVAAVQAGISAVMQQAQRVRQAAAQFGPSRVELEQTARDAKATYDYMLQAGVYTADQLAAAFKASQEAQARSLGINTEAQKKNLTALEEGLAALTGQRDQLWQQIAAEAPEEIMGVIEAGQRGQLAVLDAQIADQQVKLKAQAEAAAAELEDALSRIQPNVIHVGVVFDYQNPPGGLTVESPEVTPLAAGGYGTVDGPTLFLVGEKGREQFAASGANKTFDQVGFPAGGGGDFSRLEGHLASVDRRLAQMPEMLGLAMKSNLRQVARGRR